ncbi:hypothetical protein [Maribacter sp. 2-571]|uniref:hypothetical protein n=1 Tax=Maribacter sp. 2-571 TaxID=3417569 RepID=UPI003D33EBB7
MYRKSSYERYRRTVSLRLVLVFGQKGPALWFQVYFMNLTSELFENNTSYSIAGSFFAEKWIFHKILAPYHCYSWANI